MKKTTLQLCIVIGVALLLLFLIRPNKEGFMAPDLVRNDKIISETPDLLAPEYPDQRCEVGNAECALPFPHGGRGGFCHMQSEGGRPGFCVDTTTCCPVVNHEPPQPTPEYQEYIRNFTYQATCDKKFAPGPERDECYRLAAEFVPTLNRKVL